MDIGFIGLGEMGSAMAGNALKAGHTVRVWNRSAGRTKALAEQGASIVDTPEQAFSGDAVFSMLADDAALRAVLIDGGLLKHAPRGLVHVNMATISAAFAAELTALHAQHGVAYVAAPVLGRPDVAAAGKLNILAAGASDAIDRVQPVFDAIGQKTWRIGDTPQHANVLKLAANFMLASAIETLGEAAALVSGHGIDDARFPRHHHQHAVSGAGLSGLREDDRGAALRAGAVQGAARTERRAPRDGGGGRRR